MCEKALSEKQYIYLKKKFRIGEIVRWLHITNIHWISGITHQFWAPIYVIVQTKKGAMKNARYGPSQKKIYIISIFIKLIWITVLLMTFNTVNGIFMHTLILFHYPFKLNFMFKHSISPVLLPWAISCLLLYTYITYLCPKSEIDYSAFSLAF